MIWKVGEGVNAHPAPLPVAQPLRHVWDWSVNVDLVLGTVAQNINEGFGKIPNPLMSKQNKVTLTLEFLNK